METTIICISTLAVCVYLAADWLRDLREARLHARAAAHLDRVLAAKGY